MNAQGGPAAHLAAWKSYAASGDPAVLHALLAEDAVFLSPIVHTPQAGREKAFAYLAAAHHVFAGSAFAYVGEWLKPDGAVLEFTATIDGIHINGIDMIRWNADGRIAEFKVMVRPLKAVNLLHAMMAAQLAAV